MPLDVVHAEDPPGLTGWLDHLFVTCIQICLILSKNRVYWVEPSHALQVNAKAEKAGLLHPLPFLHGAIHIG